MSKLLIRDLEDGVVRELERRAKSNGRSVDDEVIEILRKALDREDEQEEVVKRAARRAGR